MTVPTWNKIEKRCPNGYHKDPKTGQCVDANGNSYQGNPQQEQPKQDKPKKEETDAGKESFDESIDVLKRFMGDKQFRHSELEDMPHEIEQYVSNGNYYKAINLFQEFRSRATYFARQSENKEELINSFDKVKEYLLPLVEQKEKEDKQKYKAGEKEHPEWTKEEKRMNRVRNFFKGVKLDEGETAYMTSNGTPAVYDRDSGNIYLWTKHRYSYKGYREPDAYAYGWSKIPQGTNIYLKTREGLESIKSDDSKSGKSAKKMKKGHGNYIDAIENFIVDSKEGVYYNEILDEFNDALTEDDVMDAIEILTNDKTIFYDDNTERFKITASRRKSMRKSLDVEKMMDELLELCYEYDSKYVDTVMDAQYEFSYGAYSDAKADIDEVLQGTEVGKIIALCEDIYGELSARYNASTKKSYAPDYHDFRTMLTNMKMTKDNRTAFKR